MKKIVAIVLSLVMVLGLATTAFAAGLNLYVVDTNEDSETFGKFILATDTTNAMAGMDLDDLKPEATEKTVAAYKLPNYGYVVETTADVAELKLTFGAKTIYLSDVVDAFVSYEAKVSALAVVAEDDAECGDYNITDAALDAFGYDEDDTYYAHYDVKTGVVDAVYVADKDGSVNVLVGDKLVKAEDMTYKTNVKFMAHTFEGYEIANFEYTSVKCKDCDKVAKLYSNATAAGKKAQPVLNGWITFADFVDFAPAAPAADATDKVESAQTFDAGIAMYVGMSVMAAAGSAVVLKKKD